MIDEIQSKASTVNQVNLADLGKAHVVTFSHVVKKYITAHKKIK